MNKIPLRNISIIIQGPIKGSDISMFTKGVAHYRSEFPGSKIIIAISPSPGQSDTELNQLQDEVSKFADIAVTAPSCPSLPPIKLGIGPNFFNQQRETALTGLDAVSTLYTLRVRSDMLSIKKEILDLYFKNFNFPRKGLCILKQRVLISQFFSLNPYTTEKLSFHYSDWIHFGLTEDVKKIWSVPPYPECDSAYYNPPPEAIHGTDENLKFLSRIGVEQHLYFNLVKGSNPHIRLENHSDNQSVAESIELLINNLIIDDAKISNAIPEKYKLLLNDQSIETTCITHIDWIKLNKAKAKTLPSTTLTAGKIPVENIRSLERSRSHERLIISKKKPKGPINKLLADLFIKIAPHYCSPKSKLKLRQNPNLFFYDIKHQPAKTMAHIYLKLLK